MNDYKGTIAARTCCCILLALSTTASADFVGVTTVDKDDPATDFQCTQGNGHNVPGPLTVCNVYAAFDDPADRLLSLGNADLQVYSGANPDVFFQHPSNFQPVAPSCTSGLPPIPDMICDSFVTIGWKCSHSPPATPDATWIDAEFDSKQFDENGHIVGGWFNQLPSNGQGDAGQYPPNENLQVLFLQSAVVPGLSMSGDIDIFWVDGDTGATIAEKDVPIECVAVGGCQDPEDCDDGNACTDDECLDEACVHTPLECDDGDVCNGVETCDPVDGCQPGTPDCCYDGDACTDDSCDPELGCTQAPIDCSDGNLCTDDLCDPDTGCTHEDIECPEGQVCDPANGKCIEDQDPCECVNGKVTLCHIPPGNPGNAHTITVGCNALERHLAHGDSCGPCG